MAIEKNIEVGLNVTSNGTTKREIKDAQALKAAYDSAAASAAKIGGTAGSRAMAAKAAPTGSEAMMSGEDYRQASGVTGKAGGTSRDFAKQAQGLGGLVHVYATFAANLFAVGAAFTALKNAAQTENMIKGLDDLGAASGRSLGTMAKQLANTTDGALSLRDAMTAVAQASSAGLMPAQINEIAKVASKASQALGVSMTDAISRLTRGISKIEPELLDELGIFVKVDEATQKYALSVGKSAASLSDFERRQAFANAVLEQGSKKFAAIELAANPYDKLLASVTNLATAGLTLVNKVLEPILKVLAESPSGLALVFTGIAAILLKQAIPALGNWRQELVKTADISAKNAKRIYDQFQEFSIEKGLGVVDKAQKQVNSTIADAQTVLAKSLSERSKILKYAMSDNVDASKLSKMLDTEISRSQTMIANAKELAAAEKDPAVIKAYQDKIALDEKRLANLKVGMALTAQAAKQQAAVEQQYSKIGEDPKWYTEEGMRRTIAQRKQNAATSSQIISQVAVDTQIKGVKQSFSDLFNYIQKGGPVFDEEGNKVEGYGKKLTGLSKVTTAVKGSFVIMGSAIGTALSAISPWLELIGLVVAAVQLFDSAASKAAKEQADFNAKIEEGQSGLKTISASLDLYTVKGKDAFSLDSVIAFTNGLSTVTDALEAQLLAFEKWQEKASSSAWDSFKDNFAAIMPFMESNIQKLKKSVSESISGISKALLFSSTGKEGLAEKLQIPVEVLDDAKQLNKLIQGLGEQDLTNLITQLKEIEKQEQYTTNAAKAFSDSLTEIDRIFDQIVQSTAFTDLQGKLGVELVTAAQRFNQALLDPLKTAVLLDKMFKDPKFMSVMDDKDLQSLVQAGEQIKELNKAEEALAKARKEQADARANMSASGSYAAMDANPQAAIEQANQLEEALSAANNAVSEQEVKIKRLKQELAGFALQQATLIDKITAEGFRRIEIGLKNAEKLANISVAQAQAGIAASAGIDTSRKDYELRAEEIRIQRTQIQAAYDAKLKQIENTEALQELTASMEKASAQGVLASATSTAEQRRAAEATLAPTSANSIILQQKDVKQALKSGGDLTGYDPRAIAGARAQLAARDVAIMEKRNALAKTGADLQIAGIQREDKHLLFVQRIENEKAALAKAEAASKVEALNIAAQISGIQSNELLDAKEAAQIAAINKDTDAQRLAIQAQLDRIKKSEKGYTEEELAEKGILEKKLKQLDTDKALKILAASYNTLKQKGIEAQNKLTQEQAIEAQYLANTVAIQDAKLQAAQKELDIKAQLGYYDEVTLTRLKTEAELESQNLRFTEQRARLLADIAQKELIVSNAKKIAEETSSAANGKASDSPEAIAAAGAAGSLAVAQAQLEASKSALVAGDSVNKIQVQAIQSAGQLNEKLAAQKMILDDIANVFGTLGNLFGGAGSALESFAKSMANAAIQAENNAKALAENREEQKRLNDIAAEDPLGLSLENQKKLNSLKQTETNLVKKSAKDQLSADIAIVSSTKNLFKEKTFAHKALGAVEQAMHIQRMVMWVTENAATIAALPGKIAGGVSQLFNQGGWAGFAGAAAFLALMGSLGFGGGSSSPAAFSPSSDQLKETQGTGQTWDAQGNKVATAGGIFGDSEAKANSVVKSLEILRDNSFDTLDYDNRLLKSFEKLSDSITQVVNSMLGTNVGMLPKELQASLGSTSSKTGGLFGMVASLWGSSSSSTSLYSQRLELSGTFLNAVKKIDNSLSNIATTFTQWSSSSWFGLSSDSGSFYTDTKLALPPSVTEAFQALMGNLRDTAITIAELVGRSGEDAVKYVDSKLSAIELKDSQGNPLKFEYKDLKGQDLADALNAFISSINNITLEQLFPEFERFKTFGEDYGTTVVRIIHDNQEVKNSLVAMSSSFDISTKAMGSSAYDLTETLIKGAGGLSNFTDQAKFFIDNFLTDTEKLAIQDKALTAQLQKLGLSTSVTKTQYKQLVQAQDLSTKAGRDMYQALMDLAPGFIAFQNLLDSAVINKLTEFINAFKDFAKSLASYKSSLLVGSASPLTPGEKYAQAQLDLQKNYMASLTGDKVALSNFQNLANVFLEQSKIFNASSSAYTTDFQTVLSMVDSLQSYTQSQADAAQLQLNALQAHTLYLENIDKGIAKLAGITPAARGGYRKGVTLVGEEGPEFVDFNTPGRVYTASQTEGMFALPAQNNTQQQLLMEVANLRQEVVKLREQQRTETGHLINATYDAQNKNAEAVTEGVDSSLSKQAWAERVKQSAVIG